MKIKHFIPIYELFQIKSRTPPTVSIRLTPPTPTKSKTYRTTYILDHLKTRQLLSEVDEPEIWKLLTQSNNLSKLEHHIQTKGETNIKILAKFINMQDSFRELGIFVVFPLQGLSFIITQIISTT